MKHEVIRMMIRLVIRSFPAVSFAPVFHSVIVTLVLAPVLHHNDACAIHGNHVERCKARQGLGNDGSRRLENVGQLVCGKSHFFKRPDRASVMGIFRQIQQIVPDAALRWRELPFGASRLQVLFRPTFPPCHDSIRKLRLTASALLDVPRQHGALRDRTRSLAAHKLHGQAFNRPARHQSITARTHRRGRNACGLLAFFVGASLRRRFEPQRQQHSLLLCRMTGAEEIAEGRKGGRLDMAHDDVGRAVISRLSHMVRSPVIASTRFFNPRHVAHHRFHLMCRGGS